MSGGQPRLRVAALLAYATAMGWFESVTVVYIRGLLGFTHGQPLPTSDQVEQKMRTLPWLLPTEQSREAATLLMLAAVAWLGGRSLRDRFGALCLIFGVWDITYYIGLYALVRWPTHLGEMDLLFLIPPGPWWYQPVWVPVAISVVLIVGGLALMRRARGPDQRSDRVTSGP